MPKVRERWEGGVFLGIDPGAGGGLVCIDGNGRPISVERMPPTESDTWEWFQSQVRSREIQFAIIEKVGGFIAGNPSPGSAMFKFGASYGGLRMALIAAGIPFEEVAPQRWQKEMGLTRAKNESKGSFKNRAKSKAQNLFPSEKVTLATADAILIAEYCRRTYGGKS